MNCFHWEEHVEEEGISAMSKEDEDKLKLIILLIVLVAIAGAFLGIPQDWTNTIVQWLISAFTGTIFSMVATSFVEAFTGDFLKKILITIEITDKIKFSHFPVCDSDNNSKVLAISSVLELALLI
jgi:hypothetical protein